MIVEPDFLDHWKTRLLIELTGESTAPLAVLRLWAHCQNRKTWTFPGMSADVLKSVCQWPKDAKTFYEAMRKSGFVEAKGKTLTAHDWAEVNRALVTAWENARFGKLGGRPKNENPPGSHGGSLRVAVGTPIEPIEDQERIEKIEPIEDQGGITGGARMNAGPVSDSHTSSSNPVSVRSGSVSASERSAAISQFKRQDYTAAMAIRFAITGNPNGNIGASDIQAAIGTISEPELFKIAAETYAVRIKQGRDPKEGYLVGVVRNMVKELADKKRA